MGDLSRDTRDRAEKMLDMAQQDDSPNERDFAQRWLADRGMWPPPPRPPAPAGMAEDQPWDDGGLWRFGGHVWVFNFTEGTRFYNGQPVNTNIHDNNGTFVRATSTATSNTASANGATSTRMFRGGPFNRRTP